MARVRKTLNTAVLLISHDLGVIAEVCDRVIVMYAGRVVEDADVRSIFANPSHPYTRGLLKSIPRLDDDQKRLYQIPGSVPTAGSVKEGCPFYARCPLHIDKCRSDMPPMFAFGQRHKAACWGVGHRAHATVFLAERTIPAALSWGLNRENRGLG